MPITEKQRKQNRRAHEESKPAYEALMKCYPLSLDDLPGEVWKPIAGFDDYQVSTFGRVKSFKQGKAMIRKPYLCGEYLNVSLSIDGKQKKRLVHVLVAQAFIPNLENKPEVNHDDGHKMNCYVGNLWWATRAENMQHAIRTGLKVNLKGAEHHKAKIQDEDAAYIRDNPDNLTAKELAEKFNLSLPQISVIQTGRGWKHINGDLRKSQKPRVPEEIKQKIRADYATGNYTMEALAKKYGCCLTTVWNIIHAA